jgi:tetratricopeptide (TPR) repeat protein
MDLEALRQRAARYPGDFQTRAAFGHALLEAGELDEAEEQLRAALGLFPDYAGPGTPYYGLARIHRERGELEQAARALQAIAERNEAAWEAHLEEIEIRRELGDSAGEVLALERTIEVFPYEIELHDRLAELYHGMGRPADVVRERQAVVALDPTDKAQAHYRLATAHLEAGDAAAARTQVLRALEIAPNYEAALDLLLRLRGEGR